MNEFPKTKGKRGCMWELHSSHYPSFPWGTREQLWYCSPCTLELNHEVNERWMWGAKFLTVRAEMYRGARGGGSKRSTVMEESHRHRWELTFRLIQIKMVTYRNIYRYMYTHTHISLPCQLRGTEKNYTIVATTILGFKYHSPIVKGTRGPKRNGWFEDWGRKYTRGAWIIL